MAILRRWSLKRKLEASTKTVVRREREKRGKGQNGEDERTENNEKGTFRDFIFILLLL